jgi:hypothetical protein
MFTHLSFEIRLHIWETILHEPRVVHINMRELPDPFDCGYGDGPKFESLCSTPIPVLLHLCTETRTLALAYYELTFGRANAPVLRPRTVYKHGWSYKGIEFESVTESNEAEVAKYTPKIYFNFERDTLLFGRTPCFPYGKHFHFEQLQRIENLALSIDKDWSSQTGYLLFYHLNRHVGRGRFQRLKKLYLCLETDDVDPRRGVELVDLREKVKEEEGDGGIAQEFVDIWRSVFESEGVVVNGVGMEALRIICKDGLKTRYQLRELLLKNGVSPDEVVKCVWVRDMSGGD